MKQSAGETYTAAVKVGRHELEYRIFAGDAVSRWFTLQSVPRPRVKKFVKEYFYPKYMSRPPKVEHADTGDLNEIIGTAVELTIALDQSVAEAKLHMVTPSATNVLDFAPADEPTEWTLRLPELAESGAYTVHLKTAGGLENIYRPEHAITARADLMPTIKVAKPKGSLTTRPEDILTVEGEAEDDVGLRRVEQLIRVNQQDWTTNVLQLAQLPGTNVTITLDWDLLKLDAKPGDLVLAKLAAIDLKGSRAESSPVRLKVDSAIFEAQRLAAIGRQQQWTTNLVAAAEATIEFHAALPADLKKFIEPANDASRLKQAAEALRRLDAARAADRLLERDDARRDQGVLRRVRRADARLPRARGDRRPAVRPRHRHVVAGRHAGGALLRPAARQGRPVNGSAARAMSCSTTGMVAANVLFGDYEVAGQLAVRLLTEGAKLPSVF